MEVDRERSGDSYYVPGSKPITEYVQRSIFGDPLGANMLSYAVGQLVGLAGGTGPGLFAGITMGISMNHGLLTTARKL